VSNWALKSPKENFEHSREAGGQKLFRLLDQGRRDLAPNILDKWLEEASSWA